MRWNCPHCSETVSIGIDIEQVKRAYVRCGACKGVALLQTKTAYADHEAAQLAELQMRERQLEIQAAQLQAAQAEQSRRLQQAELERARAIEAAEKAARAAAIAEAQNASQLAVERVVQSLDATSAHEAILVTPPPFNPTPAAMRAIQSNALDIAREIDLEIENTIRTLATLDRNGGNRRILRETTLSSEDITLEAETETALETAAEIAPATIEDTIITVTELENANENSAFVEPTISTPKSAAALTDQAAALANFDRSNPAMQIPSPQPPAFLMRKETLIPMPIQFATNDTNAAATTSAEPNQKILKFAVLVATIVAIVSGLYLFTQGQKLMKAAAIIESPQR